MVKVRIVVREAGRASADYSLPFELPEVPTIGSYISISRLGDGEYSEDLLVRYVWWRLKHPETQAIVTGTEKVGNVSEIIVECDIAEGPYSTDAWRKVAEAARARGAEVTTFDIARFSVSQAMLRGEADE